MFKKRTVKSNKRVREAGEDAQEAVGSKVVRLGAKGARAGAFSAHSGPGATVSNGSPSRNGPTVQDEVQQHIQFQRETEAITGIKMNVAYRHPKHRGAGYQEVEISEEQRQQEDKYDLVLASRDTSTLSRTKEGPAEATVNDGLQKLSSVRSTTVFDFARDICKDFRDTGFCGYGDSCKFVHARDDFKAGWKLNTDWDLKSKEAHELEKKLKDIPFKCVLCKKPYKDPVKTTCNHYFCESCFLKRTAKTPNCYICNKNTNGVAKPAKDLDFLLKKQ